MIMNKVTGEMRKTKAKAKRSNMWINDELFLMNGPLSILQNVWCVAMEWI